MGKRQSKQRKDAGSAAVRNNHNSNANGSSAFQTPQTLETLRNQDQKASLKPSSNKPKRISISSVPNCFALRRTKPDRVDSHAVRTQRSQSDVAAVVTDRDQGVIGSIHNDHETERGMGVTVNPGGDCFHATETLIEGDSQVGVSVSRMELEELADQVTETEIQNGQEVPHPTQVEPASISLGSLSLTQTSVEEQNPNASGEPTLTTSTTEANCTGTVNEKIMGNQNLKQKIALKLDQRHPVVKNWEHLASVLDAPLDVITTCRINAEQRGADRLFELIEAKHRDLTVKEFLAMLEGIGRNDVKLHIGKTLSGAESSVTKLCDALNANVQLSDDIALKLDTGSPAIKTWVDLVKLLHYSKKDVDLIKSGGRNPAAGIIEFVFKKWPNFTVGEFKHHMEKMERKDVIDLLRQYDVTKRLEEIMPKRSELLQEVSYCLNKNAGGSVEDWRDFAYRLKIPNDIYDSYDPKEAHSPTERLLTWLVGKYPEFTMRQLCNKVQSIDRNDVYQLIINELKKS